MSGGSTSTARLSGASAADESRALGGMGARQSGSVVVRSIFIYPIKGCRGLAVSSAHIGSTGFLWDRQWMVVRAGADGAGSSGGSSWRFLTQRQEPRLALVQVTLPTEALAASAWGELGPDACLAVEAPGMEPLHVPLREELYQKCRKPVTVWRWTGGALDAGEDAAQWFSQFLDQPCRLVRFDTHCEHRATSDHYAPGFQTAFSDGYPFLVISQESLAALNTRLDFPLPMNRFRPNIVVEGCAAFEEDQWREFRIGNVQSRHFFGVKPCSRCKVTTIDQDTAQAGKEPLPALKTFRTGAQLRLPGELGSKSEMYFGINAVCRLSSGSSSSAGLATVNAPLASLVEVGDMVTVVHLAHAAGADLGPEATATASQA